MSTNKWIEHLEEFRENNEDIPASEMMKEARKTYKKGGKRMRGGSIPNEPPSIRSTNEDVVVPYQAPTTAMSLKGGGVIPYERQATDSTYAKVGGRRRTRRSRRKSRRSRRRR
jgi:hypothetical protein